MGYEVWTEEIDFRIRQDNLDIAYESLCALNRHNDLKHGGNAASPHFSWMDANYDEKCADAREVFEHIGFETLYETDDDGAFLRLTYFSQSAGQEELFLRTIAPLVEPGSYISWLGEDGERWRWEFDGEEMHVKKASVVWE